MSAEHSDNDEGKIRVQLVSVDPRYAVPDVDMAVPGTLRRGGLSSLVNYLLGFSGDDSAMDTGGSSSSSSSAAQRSLDFDFMVGNRFLRTTVAGYVRSNNVSAEELLVLHFSLGGVLLSASYDGAIRAHGAEDLQPFRSVPAHAGAIRAMAYCGPASLLASGGLDQQLLVHEVRAGGGRGGRDLAVELAAKCGEGHEAAVEACAWSFGDVGAALTLASGDWDGKLCLWALDAGKFAAGKQSEEDGDASKKKRKTGKEAGAAAPAGVTTVTPKSVVKLHASSVSGLAWSSASPNILYSGSWDYSVKAFDTSREDVILTLNGSRVVSCLAKSSHSEVLATGHPDCHVKLWDVRVNKSVGSVMTADDSLKPDHSAWVAGVTWDDARPFNLATCSHDGTVKGWDVRCSLPLYTLKAHVKAGKIKAGKEEGKALAVCYGDKGNSIFSGGNDCQIRKFFSGVA